MSQKDLFVAVEQPPEAAVPVKCGNCLHLKDVPYYRIDGRATVCSHEKIGRKPGDVPCPNFSIDAKVYRKMSPEARRYLRKLLKALDLDQGDKTRTQRNRDAAALLHLSLVLRVMANVRKQGHELGGHYSVPDASVAGRLISCNANQGTILTDEGNVPYTTDLSKMVRG